MWELPQNKTGVNPGALKRKHILDEFEDIKVVIRIRKSKKDRQHNGQNKKKTKVQTTIYNTLHIKQKTEQHETH